MNSSASADILYDAIVVGAGPSGCSTALFLARAGHQVLLLDKARLPREKVCGDAVSGKSIGVLRELDLLSQLTKPAHGVINGLMMVAPSGKEVRVPFPNARDLDCAGYCLRRQSTDSILQQAAKSEPTITLIENFAVRSLERDAQGNVCGVSGCDADRATAAPPLNHERTYRARVLVGADGSGSVIARSLSLPPVPPEHTFMAIRGYWSGVAGLSDHIELFFIDQVLPGYLWVFPMGDGTANVGLGILVSDVKKRSKHPNKVLTDAIAQHPQLAARFSNAKLEGSIGAWTIPNGSYVRASSGPGWVLVGDAASLVDPFSGEGVGNALSSGRLAAQAIDAALGKEAGDAPLSASALAHYTSSVESLLRPEMQTSYKLQQASRSKFLLNLFIGKAASKPAFRQMIIDMLGSDEKKEQVADPLFYLKLLLP
ncbi:Digeranylgeranylglycerophospholipid reductase [uncultured archaeon]|nr:Digeranylgeranylglycerophospholipid reductase [uncultured archaeon]